MAEPDDGDQVAENVEVLKAYEDGQLLETLKAVLEDRPGLVQDLVDWAVPDRAYVSARLLTENRATGRIKSFSEHKGYGFIDCPPVVEAFGNDVWLHHGQIGGFGVGDEVTFAILLGKDRKPQAFDLSPAGGAPPWAAIGAAMSRTFSGPPPKAGGPGQASRSSGMAPTATKFGVSGSGTKGGKGKDFMPSGKGAMPTGKGPMSTGKSAPTGAQAAPGAKDKIYRGTIKSFNPMTGYGFIACDELMKTYGCDVFVLQGQYADCQIGQAVTFTIVLNHHGKPQATEVWPQGGGSTGKGAVPGAGKGGGYAGSKGGGFAGSKGGGGGGGGYANTRPAAFGGALPPAPKRPRLA